LKNYIAKGGAIELFFKRLKTWSLEEKLEIVAFKPGMPLGGQSLPIDFIEELEVWIQEECPLQSDERLCPLSKNKPADLGNR
jgi:hypothetical protein